MYVVKSSQVKSVSLRTSGFRLDRAMDGWVRHGHYILPVCYILSARTKPLKRFSAATAAPNQGGVGGGSYLRF